MEAGVQEEKRAGLSDKNDEHEKFSKLRISTPDKAYIV